MTETKRFTWLKKDVYAPQIVITDSLAEKDLTPTDCYELLNELYDENEQLKQFQEKVFDLINGKIEECEEDYNRAVKAGMPSMSIYEEVELLEWLKKELEE